MKKNEIIKDLNIVDFCKDVSERQYYQDKMTTKEKISMIKREYDCRTNTAIAVLKHFGIYY